MQCTPSWISLMGILSNERSLVQRDTHYVSALAGSVQGSGNHRERMENGGCHGLREEGVGTKNTQQQQYSFYKHINKRISIKYKVILGEVEREMETEDGETRKYGKKVRRKLQEPSR